MKKKIALILYGLSYCETYRHSSCPDEHCENKIDYRESIKNYKEYIYNYFEHSIIDVFIATNPSPLSKQLIEDYKPKDYIFVDDNNINHYARRQKEWLTNKRNIIKDKPQLETVEISSNIEIARDEIGDINSFKFFKSMYEDDEAFKKTEIWGPSSRLQRNLKPIKGMELCLNYSKKNNINYNNIILSRMDLIFKKKFETCSIDLNKINIVTQMEDGYSLCDNFYIIPFDNLQGFLDIYKKNEHESLHKIRPDIEKLNKINFICNENNGSSKLSFYKINRIKL
jgi:hypothetical protein